MHGRPAVKTKTILRVSAVTLSGLALAGAACGGSAVNLSSGDGGEDGSSSGGGDGATTGPFDGTTASPDAAGDAPGSTTSDGSGQADAGGVDAAPPCAPPADGAKAALCITFTHDTLAFVAGDPSFDGKGMLYVDVHDTANPDAPDGGSLPALAGTIFPMSDAGVEIDLAGTLPAARFDALPPGVVYPRAIFIDSRSTQTVGAGWWLGGYDLGAGLRTPALLQPVSLTAGAGTGITINPLPPRSAGSAWPSRAAPRRWATGKVPPP